MMGINVNRTISFTFLIAGGLAGAAGVVYAMYFTSVRFDQGFQLGLFAFTAAVLGGIGNLPGAVLGAPHDRPRRGVQQTAELARAGWRLEAVDRLRDPDPDPRLPARGPARGEDAGRRVALPGRGAPREAPRIVARLAAPLGAARPVGVSEERWHEWPLTRRRAFIAGLVGVLALVILTPLSGFDISALGAYLIFVVMYVPEWRRFGRFGKFVIPLAFLAIVAGYPEYGFNWTHRHDLHDPDPGSLPERPHRGRDADLRDDGRRPEHGRRLRGPARPGLRRVLRHRRVHGGDARVDPVRRLRRARQFHAFLQPRRRRDRQDARRHPHLDLAAPDPRRGGHIAARHADRVADAAAARRLSRDRDARFRGDPPADRAQREQHLRDQPHERPAGHHVDGRDGIRQHDPPRVGFLPANYLDNPNDPTTSSSGPRSAWSCSRSSSLCASATRSSAGPGSRSGRTRRPRRQWAFR